jgi:hypothetical protein
VRWLSSSRSTTDLVVGFSIQLDYRVATRIIDKINRIRLFIVESQYEDTRDKWKCQRNVSENRKTVNRMSCGLEAEREPESHILKTDKGKNCLLSGRPYSLRALTLRPHIKSHIAGSPDSTADSNNELWPIIHSSSFVHATV